MSQNQTLLPPDLISINEAAALLRCSRHQAAKLIRRDRIVTQYRHGSRFRVSRGEIEAYIRESTIPPAEPRDDSHDGRSDVNRAPGSW